jgi:hypothetical protein
MPGAVVRLDVESRNGDPGRCFHRAGATPWYPPVRPSSLGPSAFRPDQGRARSTPSGEAEPGASWFGVRTTLGHHIPLSCVRAAETTLVSGHPLSRAPAVLDPAWACDLPCGGAASLPVLVFAPLPSAPVQSGLPVGTSSCSTRDGLLSEHNQDGRNGARVNCGALWKLLTSLLINDSRTCERPSAFANGRREKWRSILRHGSS